MNYILNDPPPFLMSHTKFNLTVCTHGLGGGLGGLQNVFNVPTFVTALILRGEFESCTVKNVFGMFVEKRITRIPY